MHAEDCLVEANGRQWRSFAVEGAVDKVGGLVGCRVYYVCT